MTNAYLDDERPAQRRRRNPATSEPEAGTSEDVEPATNLLRMAASTSSANTGRGARHGETEISKIPVSLKSPWPKTVQVLHNYYKVFNGTVNTEGAIGNKYAAFSFRLNSIYDIRRDGFAGGITDGTTEVALGTADTSDAVVQTPTWREYYQTYYNYWSVVRTRWRIRFRPTTKDSDGRFMIYFYEHGQQDPRIVNTAGGTELVTHQMRRLHPNCWFKEVECLPEQVGGSGTEQRSFWVTQAGSYTPGSIEHEVMEDELAQTWHKLTEVPPLKEALTIVVTASPTSGASPQTAPQLNASFVMEVSIDYETQWKDLKVQYHYMSQDIANPSITNAWKQVN